MQPVADLRPGLLEQWLGDATGRDEIRLGDVLTGGNSNVTRLIETRQGRLVLRHPPVNVVSDKAAAGIEREYRAISALYGKAPVPKPVAWCSDASVIGQPFAVTEWIDGHALSERLPPDWPQTAQAIDALGLAMVRGLAQVHALDWRETVDPGFGRPEGFVERQIARWLKVRENDAVRELPLLAQIAAWLRAHEPQQPRASVIHCDFHLDNCLMARTGPELRAILDWEMATLGDPRIDLGLCLFFWQRDAAASPGFAFVQGLSNRTDVISPRALAYAWSEASGLDHDSIDYFIVFAAWRLAAIVEGAWVLQCRGKEDTAYARGLEHDVPALLREAAAIIDKGKV
ncbi:phosphotransferase family protein [Novosphingobium sp.]|uniref:phosphotransferase family protein n=1 Tax=Novosphingobium sp. TaxID=1874826 RepID=UPI002618DB0B|nr:phosphotransferase family protein [Novosphingobium sp.]